MSAAWRAVERLLFGEALSPGAEGLNVSVQPAWPLGPGVSALIVAIGLMIVLTVYWRERPSAPRRWKVLLAAIRTALVCLVVFMLCGWTFQRHRTDRPDVVIVLDDSASMSIVDSLDDSAAAAEIARRVARVQLDAAARINLAKTLLLDRNGELLRGLQQRYRVRFVLAGASARPLPSDDDDFSASLKAVHADQTASRLGNCLRDVIDGQRGRSTAAIILFTDGITTDGKPLGEAAEHARRQSIPLFCVGLGSDRLQRDLSLTDLIADDAAFVGDVIHFDFKLNSSGYSGTAKVRLKRNGEAESLAEETVALDKAGATQALRLAHRVTEPGEFEYMVEISPGEGEANLENNRLIRQVVVRDEVVRVLLVQAYPSYEFRFLKQMLLRELNSHQPADGKAAGFRTVLQEADLAYSESDKTAQQTFPASREELFAYDVLIFGDVNPALLSPTIMNHIYEFVNVRGGGVVFIAGPRYTPLAYRGTPIADLLPMSIDTVTVPDADAAIGEEFRPRLTLLGQSSPMMQLADSPSANERVWNEQLGPLRWLVSAPDLRPGVRVLAEHPTRETDRGLALPVITLQFVGAGKVVFHATDETYRWRFRIGDVYFARYWVQTIRYLCRSKLLAGSREVELTTDREQYERGDEVSVRARFLNDRLAPAEDDGVAVVVEDERGQQRRVSLHRQAADRGLFAGSAGAFAAGRYRAWLATPATSGNPAASEFTVVAPPEELARTQMDSSALREAAKTGLGKFYAFSSAGKLLTDLPAGKEVRIESLPPKPIWNSPVFAGLFVALITAEWLLRKRVGLL